MSLKERLQDYIKDIEWSINSLNQEIDYMKAIDEKAYEIRITYLKGQVDEMKDEMDCLKDILLDNEKRG